MRRAQSNRGYSKTTHPTGTIDDMGALRETAEPESIEDGLRKQALDMDRENDKLKAQIQALQAQLVQRPPLEAVQELQKEYKNLDLLLQGTQRENERCMSELERSRKREKMLEQELEKLAGANWQNSLNIQPATVMGRRVGDMSTTSLPSEDSGPSRASIESTIAHVEQVRLMILGMEQRLESRETELAANIRKAQAESTKFEEMRTQILSSSS